MTRPTRFEKEYMAVRDQPYEIVEELTSGKHMGGGVIGKGHCVWMQTAYAALSSRTVPVFDEDLGIIYLDPRLLRRHGTKV